MIEGSAEHTLEFLLAFDGRRHWYEGGYNLKFEIRRSAPTTARPHGLRYSFTLHDPKGRRLVGFDNAHALKVRRRGRQRHPVADHWHRNEKDPGRPYQFKGAEQLLDDFFDEVERVLEERGVPLQVIADEDHRS